MAAVNMLLDQHNMTLVGTYIYIAVRLMESRDTSAPKTNFNVQRRCVLVAVS